MNQQLSDLIEELIKNRKVGQVGLLLIFKKHNFFFFIFLFFRFIEFKNRSDFAYLVDTRILYILRNQIIFLSNGRKNEI
jgi:hypothetical protein